MRSPESWWFPILFLVASHAAAQNPIQIENAKPGTVAWKLTNPATNREVEGYASRVSVNKGESIKFYINVKNPATNPTVSVAVYRMGWYGGLGGRQVHPVPPDFVTNTVVAVPATAQPACSADSRTGLIDCAWTESLSLTIPSTWVSGIYLARLSLARQQQSYIVFIVRDDASTAHYLFQASVLTWQAYNNWPGGSVGKSLYPWSSMATTPCPRHTANPVSGYECTYAVKVSFNRPYAIRAAPGGGTEFTAASGVGAGEFLTTLNHPGNTSAQGQEYNMVRFLERLGYDVAYSTDLDTHERGALLLNHRAFLVVGHDEYWTGTMRDNVEAARNGGVNLGFFAANSAYNQVRLEDSGQTSVPNRIVACYRGLPDYENSPEGVPPEQSTILFRYPGVDRPEDDLLGVRFEDLTPTGPPPQYSADLVISDPSHWVVRDTGLTLGQHIAGLVGYEADERCVGAGRHPPASCATAERPISVVASSPVEDHYSQMTSYQHPSGATVVAAGTIQWSWGLDNYKVFDGVAAPVRIDTRAVQMTQNILERFRSYDRVDLVARGTDNAVWHLGYAWGQWGWQTLGGGFLSGPAIASSGINRLSVFGVGLNSALYGNSWSGSAWGGWVHLGTPPGLSLSSDPAAASSNVGRVDVVARAGDNSYWWRSQVGGAWSGWQSLGGGFVGGPAATSWGPDVLVVFGIGYDGALWNNLWNGSGWSGWVSLGRPAGRQLVGKPGAVSWGVSRLDVFVRDTTGAGWHLVHSDTGWSWQAQSIGSGLGSDLAVSSWAPNRLELFAKNSAGTLQHKSWNATSGWSNWVTIPGSTTSSPAAISWYGQR